MLQSLPIALAQVKASNTSKNLLIEIRQIIYFLYQTKEITKNVYNNLIQQRYNTKVNAIFLNSRNSKTSDPYRLLLNVADKIDLKRSDKYLALSNFIIYYTQKNIKKSQKNNKFKILPPTWNKEFKLLDGSHSISDIQDHFGHILRKH